MKNPLAETQTLEVLTARGFQLTEERHLDPKTLAAGYTSPDGTAVIWVTNCLGTSWSLLRPGAPEPVTGEGDAGLALALDTAPVPRSCKSTEQDRLVSALRQLGGDYSLACLTGENGYGLCMRVLKKLRNVSAVPARDCTPARVEAALALALDVPTKLRNGARMAQLAIRAEQLMKDVYRAEKAARRAEAVRIAKLLRGRPVVAGAAPKPLKRKSQRVRAAERAALQAELKERIEDRETQPPLATPKPDATVVVRAADVRLLEDPENGLVLLQVEKENSQGAICVYNNGVRVAAGVVSPETMKTLRPIPGADIIQAANQLLNPFVESVVVTPVAHRHLTAVLDCKEIKPMTATAVVTPSKSAKFAPPTKVAGKKPSAKATKTADGDGYRATYSDDTVFAFVRGLKEGEKVKGSNKRGTALLEFIKGEKKATQAKIIKAVPKLTETSQGPEKIWAFYRPLLLDLGVIKVSA